jgi:hypothetical protein
MLLQYRRPLIIDHDSFGGVAERLIAPVLKTGRPNGLVSSNLTPSVPFIIKHLRKENAVRIKVSHDMPRQFSAA